MATEFDNKGTFISNCGTNFKIVTFEKAEKHQENCIIMGLFWNLLQQSQIQSQQDKANSIEERVFNLENELKQTKDLLQKTLEILENHLQRDIDGDGITGKQNI